MSNILKGLQNALQVVSSARSKISIVKAASVQTATGGSQATPEIFGKKMPAKSDLNLPANTNELVQEVSNGQSDGSGQIINQGQQTRPTLNLGPVSIGAGVTTNTSTQITSNIDGTVTVNNQSISSAGIGGGVNAGVNAGNTRIGGAGGIGVSHDTFLDLESTEITSNSQNIPDIIDNINSPDGLTIAELPEGTTVVTQGRPGFQVGNSLFNGQEEANLNIGPNVGPASAQLGYNQTNMHANEPMTSVNRGTDSVTVGIGETTTIETSRTGAVNLGFEQDLNSNNGNSGTPSTNNTSAGIGLNNEIKYTDTVQISRSEEVNYPDTPQGIADAQNHLNTGQPTLQSDGRYVVNNTTVNTHTSSVNGADLTVNLGTNSNPSSTETIRNLEVNTQTEQIHYDSVDGEIGRGFFGNDQEIGIATTNTVNESAEDGVQGFEVSQATYTPTETAHPSVSRVNVQLEDGNSLDLNPNQVQSYAQQAVANGNTNPVIADLADGTPFTEAINDNKPFGSYFNGDNENAVGAIQELQAQQASTPNLGNETIHSVNVDAETGETTRIEQNQANSTASVTVSTADTNAASSPTTNETTTYGVNGITSTTNSITTPTGLTIEEPTSAPAQQQSTITNSGGNEISSGSSSSSSSSSSGSSYGGTGSSTSSGGSSSSSSGSSSSGSSSSSSNSGSSYGGTGSSTSSGGSSSSSGSSSSGSSSSSSNSGSSYCGTGSSSSSGGSSGSSSSGSSSSGSSSSSSGSSYGGTGSGSSSGGTDTSDNSSTSSSSSSSGGHPGGR